MYVIGHAANYLSPVTHAELLRSFSQFKPAPACSHSFAYIFECFFFLNPTLHFFFFSVDILKCMSQYSRKRVASLFPFHHDFKTP